MSADGCAETRISLGAYVLGALDPAERGRVESHLASCSNCREELASFAALPGLLGRVSRAEVEATTPPPSSDLLDRLLAAATAERRHDRRVRWLTSAAAAVVVLAALAVGLGVSLTHHSARVNAGASQTVAATDPLTHVSATVKEVQKGWGTALEVKVTGISVASYGSALRCQLLAIGADGQTDVAGSWTAPASDHAIEATGATALPAAGIKAFRIVGSDGTTLVSIPARWAAKA